MTVTVLQDNVKKLAEAIAELAGTRVMVGIPADKAPRNEGPINNASLGYIHEFGAPEANIPARPFLHPGVASVQQSVVVPKLKQAGEAFLSGEPGRGRAYLNDMGQKASDAVRDIIVAHIPPPLKPGTLLGRLRRKQKYRKAAPKRKAKLREAALAGSEGATPLLDTGILYRSIKYVLRKTS